MRRLIAICLLLAAPMAWATDIHYSKPAVRKELIAVVDAQLAAFRASDFAGAYKFAATPLRLQFELKEFTAMVARSYPLITHNVRAEFGLPMDDDTTATLQVRVFGPGGRVEEYRYTLTLERAGWRISGVLPAKTPGPDA